MAIIVAILAGFIVAGPVLLLRVSKTEAQVTELWLAYHRLLAAPEGVGERRVLEGSLDAAMERLRENQFFSTIQNRAPHVEDWLEEIESGVSALRSGEELDRSRTDRAFGELSAFMTAHAEQQYRALQTVIWSAILLLVGIASFLTYLYIQNRKLTDSLNGALKAKSRLIQETHHRVKNNLALVASLVNLKEHFLGDRVDLSDLRNRIGAIERVHEMLSQNETGMNVSMEQYVQDLAGTALDSVAGPGVERTISVAPIELPAKKAVALGIIINELITNAVKHAFRSDPERSIEVLLEHTQEKNEAVLTIANSGAPLPEEFDPEEASSLGVQLVTGLTEQLSGSLEVHREPRTSFSVRFPV